MGVDDHVYDFPKGCLLQRSSRVDKGVSANQLVLSMRLPAKFSSEFLKEKFQQTLPNDIILYDIVKSSKRFDANSDCSARTYYYYLPKYMLIPFELYPEKLKEQFEKVMNQTTG